MTAYSCGCAVMADPAQPTAIGNLLVQATSVGAPPAGASIHDVVRANTPRAAYVPVVNEAGNVMDEGQS